MHIGGMAAPISPICPSPSWCWAQKTNAQAIGVVVNFPLSGMEHPDVIRCQIVWVCVRPWQAAYMPLVSVLWNQVFCQGLWRL